MCAWIGNTERIAAKHYVQVTDEHFATATAGAAESDAEALQKPTLPAAVSTRQPSLLMTEAPAIRGFSQLLATSGVCSPDLRVPPRGIEPLS